jgi:hypothetical protein
MTFSRATVWLAPLLLAASTLTCGGDLSAPHSDPVAIASVVGDGQAAPAGTVLPVALVISVTDAEGRPVPGVTVTWAAQGGGSVSETSVNTDDNGHVSVQRTLGSGTGTQTTIATASGLSGSPVTFTATSLPVGSETMALTVQPPVSVLDKEVFAPDQQPAVKVLNPSGAPMVGRDVTVSIASGSATVIGQTTATTNSAGVASFTDLGIHSTGGTAGFKLEFTDGVVTVQSPTITVNPLPPEASTGKWGPLVSGWDIVPLHMHLLPTGKILAWGRQDQPRVWDPESGTFTTVAADAMLFCSGHALMPDGRLMVSGGHLDDDKGLAVTHFFTPSGDLGNWNNAGGALMAKGRWYPTVTVLPDGRVVTVAGRDATSTVVSIPEVWNGSSWVQLTNASKSFPYYPRDFVAPDGRVFYAGEMVQTWWLDVNANGGTGKWTAGPSHQWPYNRDYGSAIMYDDGKILYVGGGGDDHTNNPHSTINGSPTNTAEIIDLNDASPSWSSTNSMEFRRRHLNATVLPDHEVLVTGGLSGGTFNDLSTAVQEAEIWNPSNGRWTTLASAQRPRGYHAVSLLLPSGEVLHGASGDANVPIFLPNAGTPYPREMNHEIFTPPYLFKGNRPTITSVPSTVTYGQSFTVQTPYAAQITSVTWIRLPSVTHAFDQNGRLNTLSFSRTSEGLTVHAPASGNLAPPGHYMLFILNRNGVPSTGQIIRIQ